MENIKIYCFWLKCTQYQLRSFSIAKMKMGVGNTGGSDRWETSSSRQPKQTTKAFYYHQFQSGLAHILSRQ